MRIDGTAGRFRRALPALAVLLPAGLLFLLHALLFGSWIVDDAGISFAYVRRDAAAGHEDAIRTIRQELIDHYARQDARAASGPQGPVPGPFR